MNKTLVAVCIGVAAMAGCEKERKNPGTTSSQSGGAAPSGAATVAKAEHNRIPIGETTVGSLKLVATMDAPVKPGGEGAFDLVITGGKPKAVRFWVGTEDAQGSVKARAAEETPDNWHAHAEVPDPLPGGSKFWVEVEPQDGEPFKASFDLKVQ